jgi:hypothetical protein
MQASEAVYIIVLTPVSAAFEAIQTDDTAALHFIKTIYL